MNRYTVLMFCRLPALPLALVFVAVVGIASARAQAEPDPWQSARWRFGPLAVTPAVTVKNLGWDGNVFLSTTDPKSDFTTTAGATADWWLRFGKARLHAVDYFEGVYFATYTNQGGFNQRHDLTLLVPLNRVRPYVGGYYLSTNDRPGFEIDARVRHTELNGNVGAVIRVASRLDLDISGRQTGYTYDDQDVSGAPFSTTLDRNALNYGAEIRYRVSSLTKLTLLADGVRERFTEATDRDNDGFRILPGVEFDPYALIKGKAQVGYRKLNTLAAGMPDYSGLVASIDLSYALRGVTRFGVGGGRDIYFSYETTEPFYVQTGLNLSVTQQVTGPWDVQARGGWNRLAYQQAATAGTASTAGRVDHYNSWGGGVGYRVGKDIRVGFNIDSFRRISARPDYSYDGVRGGMAVTYVPK